MNLGSASRIALLSCLLGLLPACAAIRVAPPAAEPEKPAEEPSQAADQIRYHEGLAAFGRGDYDQAAALFEPLARHCQSPDLRRRARYALASVNMITADTPGEMRDAVNLWRSWALTDEPSEVNEDPRLMAPLLDRLLQAPLTQPKPAAQSKPKPQPKPRFEIDPECRENAAQLTDCRKNVKSLERRIKQLQDQMRALEAIHLEIQEKKKEMSAPR